MIIEFKYEKLKNRGLIKNLLILVLEDLGSLIG